MAEKVKKAVQKKPPTPRQAEIKRLQAKQASGRSDQESARLDQLQAEERRDRFLRLAPKRTQNVLSALARLSTCGRRNSYQYTEDEAAKIVNAVKAEIAKIESAFSERKKEKATFTL